jgi:hypothetical protein
MTWTYTNEENETVNVPLEDWMWGVVYKDGTELHQFDDKGTFHRVGEIDQQNVKMWVLYQPHGTGRIDIPLPKDKEVKLIHKYKRYVFNAKTEAEVKKTVHVFGYKVKGQTPHYNYILPDGRILQGIGEDVPLSNYNI